MYMDNDGQLGKQLAKTINPKNNTLEFHINSGAVIYIDKLGEKHKAKFGTRDYGYLLLSYLVQHPGKTFTPEEIVTYLNKDRGQREGAKSTPDRQVRDTIQTIRRKLKLTKNKKSDFFNVDRGFGIKCAVVIKPASPIEFS